MVKFQGTSKGRRNIDRWSGGIHRLQKCHLGLQSTGKWQVFLPPQMYHKYTPNSIHIEKVFCVEGTRHVDPGTLSMVKRKGTKMSIIYDFTCIFQKITDAQGGFYNVQVHSTDYKSQLLSILPQLGFSKDL